MRHLRLSVLSVLAAALLGSPAPAPTLRVPSPRDDDMVIKHKWDVIPDDWLSLGPPPDDTTFDLHIALHPKHKNALNDALYEVSQPGHPKYGAHLSKEQVAELVAPHPDTLELVSSWLEHNGVPPSSISTTHGGGWLTIIDVPVSQANELLGASYQYYYHAGRNDTIIRTASYALPAALHVHVQTVVPTTAFTSTRPLQQTPSRRSGEAALLNATSGEHMNILSGRQQEGIEPSVLDSIYHTAGYVPPVAANSRLGIVGHEDEYPDLIDQSTFRHSFRSNARVETVTLEAIYPNVLKTRGYKNARANLFAQFAAAMTYPIPITFYGAGVRLSTTGNGRKEVRVIPGANDAIHNWLKYTVSQQSNPHTIGLIPDGISELNLSLEYMEAVCNLFKGLGARGTTVLVPSGDLGVGSGTIKAFNVNFPASCPYVTSVGGTMGRPEVASTFSGGGFSRFFQVEDYQKDEVNAYVQNLGDTYQNRYALGGRGVPDIAAQSMKYTYVYNRRDKQMNSTLCSTITAAAIFALINDYRLSQGSRPLGFVNPWLYGIGSMGFNDIIVGNNPGARTRGFSADEGWDPVTGLGTPDFILLRDLLGPIFIPGQPERGNQSFHDRQ